MSQRVRLVPEILVVVRRGAVDRFRVLSESFAGEAVRVIWDRRAAGEPAPVRSDQRRGSPESWDAFDFVVVGPDEAPSRMRHPGAIRE